MFLSSSSTQSFILSGKNLQLKNICHGSCFVGPFEGWKLFYFNAFNETFLLSFRRKRRSKKISSKTLLKINFHLSLLTHWMLLAKHLEFHYRFTWQTVQNSASQLPVRVPLPGLGEPSYRNLDYFWHHEI
jgi:hypothetical protein